MKQRLKFEAGFRWDHMEVLREIGKGDDGKRYYMCRCVAPKGDGICGKEFAVQARRVGFQPQSCGCIRRSHKIKRAGGNGPAFKAGDTVGPFIILERTAKAYRVRCNTIHAHELTRLVRSLQPFSTCPDCDRLKREDALGIGTVVSNDEIIEITSERDEQRQAIVVVKCIVCGKEDRVTRLALYQNQKSGAVRRCEGCKEAEFIAAMQTPLILTDAQAREAIRAAKRAVGHTLGAKGRELEDEIVGETMLFLCTKGATLVTEDIGAMAYRAAEIVCKRLAFAKQPKFIKPELDEETGEYDDVFDRVDVKQPNPHDSVAAELRRAAFEVALEDDEKAFMIKHQSNHGVKSAEDNLKYRLLTQAVRDCYDALVSQTQTGGTHAAN